MATTAAPKTPSVWEDFVEIFVSPSNVFARRMGRGFLIPLVVLTVVCGALAIGTKPLMQPIFDAVWTQQEAAIKKQNPQITTEQLAKGREIGEKFGSVAIVIGLPIAVLLSGLVLWFVGKLFDSEQTAGDAMMVSSYAFFPKILAFVAGALIARFSDPSTLDSPYSITLGLGHFLHPGTSSPALVALLGRVDVFTIWVTILLGLGLHITGKIPKGKAFAAAAIVWVIGALPGLLQGLRQG
jgi:hypothetical protein